MCASQWILLFPLCCCLSLLCLLRLLMFWNAPQKRGGRFPNIIIRFYLFLNCCDLFFFGPSSFVSCHFSFFLFQCESSCFHRIFILWRWRKRGWVDCGERRSSLSEMKSQSEEKIVFRTVTTDTRGQMHLCLVERERDLFSLFTTSRSVADVFHSISSILYFCHALRLLFRPCTAVQLTH